MRVRTSAIAVVLLWLGCGILESPPPWQLQLRLEREAIWSLVLRGGEEPLVAILQQEQGSPVWGIAPELRLSVVAVSGNSQWHRRMEGRLVAALPLDTLLWLLLDSGGGWSWIAIDSAGAQREQRKAHSAPDEQVMPLCALGRGRWVCRGRSNVWLYDAASDHWRRVGQSVVAVSYSEQAPAVVWVQREGEQFSLYVLTSTGQPVRIASLMEEPLRLWALPGGRSAVATQDGAATRVRVWREDGAKDAEWRFPGAPKQVAVLGTDSGVSLCWLRAGRRVWEVWQQSEDGRSHRIARVRSDGSVASLYSLGAWWFMQHGTMVVAGTVDGVMATGRAAHELMTPRQWVVEPSVSAGRRFLLAADGQRVQLWELDAVPPVSQVLPALFYGLAALTVVALLLVGGRRGWKALQQWMLTRYVRTAPAGLRLGLIRWGPKGAELVEGTVYLPGSRNGVLAAGNRGHASQENLSLLLNRLSENSDGSTCSLFAHGADWYVYVPLGASWGVVAQVTGEVDKRRLELTGQVTHELRGELARLGEELERLKQLGGSNAGFEPIQARLRRLRALIDSATALARTNPQLRTVSLSELWERLRDEYEDEIRTGTIVLQPIMWHVSVRGDGRWLYHALRNVVENALKALEQVPSGGRVWIRCHRERQFVVIEVCDNGPGISVSQGEPKPQGLGMRIIQRVAEASGGKVDWSPAEGTCGTCVRLRLPRIRGDMDDGRDGSRTPRQAAFGA